VQTAAVAVSGVAPLEYLCWDAASTALVAGNASTAARVDWLHGSSAITTQALAGLDVSSLPVIRPTLTTHYARADASVTVDLLGGITVAAPALQGTFRASRRAMYIGLGFSDDGSSFLFFLLTSFSKGIYALNLGSGAVGYVSDGIAAVLPGSGVRVPALPPPASP
jgi:hypothetical protein